MSHFTLVVHSVLLLTLLGLPTAAHAKRVLYAVAVGNNAPPAEHPELAPLRYADDDAARFYRLLAQDPNHASLLTAFDAETQRRHQGLAERAQAPSLENLRTTLERFRPLMQADRSRGDLPVLFLSFSGHGADDEHGEPALAFVDAALTRTRLYREILPLAADAEVHIIVDACRASGVLGLRGAFNHEREGTTAELTQAERNDLLEATTLAAFPNVGALVATTVDQDAHEWSRFESGVFSHEILSALRGAADINGDHKLSYSEVQAFVAAANRDVSNPKARATLISRAPGPLGDAVLLELADLAGSRLVHGDPRDLGHFFVELESGERLLDAHRSAGHTLALALPADEAGYLRTVSRELASAPQEARISAGTQPLRMEQLAFRPTSIAPRGSIEASLRDKLWSSDFGPLYYRGFIDSRGLPGVSFGAPEGLPVEAGGSAREPNDDRESAPSLRRKRLALGCAVVAGTSFAAAVTSLALALSSKRDFEDTAQERRAVALKEDYERRMAATIATSAVAATLGAATFWLWPRVSPAAGATSASLELGWRF